MNKVLKLVDQLALQIPNANRLNNTISNVNIAWHIEHSCLVIIKVAETIVKSDSNNYTTKFSFTKIMVFLTGKFPRGRAKAPKSVLPDENITEQHLLESIAKAKQAINEIKECHKNQFFSHPIFGNLNVPNTLKFFSIHTNHHLLIINDILK
jgi:hypothetical protein